MGGNRKGEGQSEGNRQSGESWTDKLMTVLYLGRIAKSRICMINNYQLTQC